VLGVSQWNLIVWPQYIGYICLLLASMCTHTHTHTEFYIEFSRSMVMRQTYVVFWWNGQYSHSKEKNLIVVDNFAIHNYKVCLSHVSFQIWSIWCHKPKDPNLNYVWIFHFLVFLIPYRHMVSFLCLMHCIICSFYGRDPESFQRSGSHLWSLGARRVA